MSIRHPQALERVISGEADNCEEVAREAREEGPAIGGVGRSAARLVATNLSTPDQAKWEPLYTLLGEEHAGAESKQTALEILLTDWSQLPEDVRTELREVYVSSNGFAAEPALSRAEGYTAVTLAVGHRLGVVTSDELRERFLVLLRGDGVRRAAAAKLINIAEADVLLDVYEVLAADGDVAVRAEAVAGLLNSGSDDPRAVRVVDRLLTEDGSWVAYRATQVLTSKWLRRGGVTDVALRSLSAHQSARVRMLAWRANARQEQPPQPRREQAPR